MPLTDVSYYFCEGRLRPGLDFTGNRVLLKAVILEWLRQHPGPQSITAIKDAVNCGNALKFDTALHTLVREKRIRLFDCTPRAVTMFYSFAAISTDEWLKHTAAEQAQEVADVG